jgi:hypothetical protein
MIRTDLIMEAVVFDGQWDFGSGRLPSTLLEGLEVIFTKRRYDDLLSM